MYSGYRAVKEKRNCAHMVKCLDFSTLEPKIEAGEDEIEHQEQPREAAKEYIYYTSFPRLSQYAIGRSEAKVS
jgi:hypothetical protein